MAKRLKLSFSIPSKARTQTHPATAAAGFRSNDEERDSAPAPRFITVFEPSQNLTPDVKPAAAVLPPLPNSGGLPNHRSGEPTGAPTSAVSGTTPKNPSSSHTSYGGLIVRNTAAATLPRAPAVIPPLPNSVGFHNHQSQDPADACTGAGTISNKHSSHTSYGLIVRNTAAAESADAATEPPPSQPAADGSSDDLMLRRYKEDMAILPDQPDEEEYDMVPVEGFGAALLAGYGWKQGDAIGKNCTKEEAKVVQYDRRAGAHGLGYESSNSKKRDMETRDQMRTSQQGKAPNARDSQQAARSVSCVNYKVPCLHSHIRVRVVSKNMSKRLYMMKGRVIDVTGPTTCDIVMDDGTEVVQGVEQDMLETVLPPVNGHALVLCGNHKGVYGRLVEKNPEDQTGVLEDADTKDMICVELDKIAEYVGDPELIGY